MTPEQISIVVLAVLGAILSGVFKYWPEARAWFESFRHQGIVMLCMVVLVAAAYLGLACTPYAGYLHITLSCNTESAFAVLQAVALIAMGNQLAYLYLPPPDQG